MPNHKKFKKKPLTAKQRKNLSKAMKGNKNAIGAENGRPSEYTPKIGKIVYEMLLLMHPVTHICKALEISQDTYYRWIKEIPDFSERVWQGTHGIDNRIGRALTAKAAGFKKRVEKPIKIKNMEGNDEIVNHVYVEYHPPDTRAIEIWLRNRSNVKKQWSSMPDEDLPPPPAPTVNINQIDLSKLDDETIRKLLTAINPAGSKS